MSSGGRGDAAGNCYPRWMEWRYRRASKGGGNPSKHDCLMGSTLARPRTEGS